MLRRVLAETLFVLGTRRESRLLLAVAARLGGGELPFLHGETRAQLLERIHAYSRPRTYLEIGVETGHSLRLAHAAEHAIGVDPNPRLRFELPPQARVFAETSDDFFARRDVRALLGGLPLDLAFIDGMHHFEFALRDFINVERLAAPGSTILIDDCFPHDRTTARRERVTTFWSGDVWKVVLLLKKYRPELVVRTVAAPPTGVCIVRNLDPSSSFLADNLSRLVEEFMPLDYGHIEGDRANQLNLFPNDWERVRELL